MKIDNEITLKELFEKGADPNYKYSDIKLNFKDFEIVDSDWEIENISNVDYKMKIQNVICGFEIIENNIASSACPEISQYVDNCKTKIIKYMSEVLNRAE